MCLFSHHEYLEHQGEKKIGSIHKDTDNKPEALVSLDQLQSAQPVLVPQL